MGEPLWSRVQGREGGAEVGTGGVAQGGTGSSTSQGGCFLPPSTLHEKLSSGPVCVLLPRATRVESHSVISAGHMWVDRTPEEGKHDAGWTTAQAVLGQAANRTLTQQTSSSLHWRRHRCNDVIIIALTSSSSHWCDAAVSGHQDSFRMEAWVMTEVHEGELAGGTENETPVTVEEQNRQSRRTLQWAGILGQTVLLKVDGKG